MMGAHSEIHGVGSSRLLRPTIRKKGCWPVTVCRIGVRGLRDWETSSTESDGGFEYRHRLSNRTLSIRRYFKSPSSHSSFFRSRTSHDAVPQRSMADGSAVMTENDKERLSLPGRNPVAVAKVTIRERWKVRAQFLHIRPWCDRDYQGLWCLDGTFENVLLLLKRNSDSGVFHAETNAVAVKNLRCDPHESALRSKFDRADSWGPSVSLLLPGQHTNPARSHTGPVVFSRLGWH